MGIREVVEWYTIPMNNASDIANQIKDILEVGLHDVLEETRRDTEMRLLQLEDIGWKRLYGDLDDEEGVSLDVIKDLSEDLYDMVATSPLIRRAVQLRQGYTFGHGYQLNIPKNASMVKNVIEEPYNWDALMSEGALEALLVEDAAAGNAFHIKVGKGRGTKIISVPLSQITGIITDEDDAQRVHYFQRTWTVKGQPRTQWIPLHRFKENNPIPSTINSGEEDEPIPVSKDTVGFMYTGLRPAGWTFGIPTALAAKAWLVAYTEVLQDNALLVKALSLIAWKFTSKTSKGSKAVGAEIASPKGVGASVNMSDTQDVSAVPRGNDVNFNNVQPLAALVASTFGISVIALLSSPGATGGSYGAATTLDEPTKNVMSALRKKMRAYLEEIMDSISPTVQVNIEFPSMSTDPDYRRAQALAVSYETGALHQREYRDAILEVYPVPDPEKSLPKTEEPVEVAGQGKTGPVPGGFNQGETDHNNDTDG